eukprot:scpid37121/ scgid18908/ 
MSVLVWRTAARVVHIHRATALLATASPCGDHCAPSPDIVGLASRFSSPCQLPYHVARRTSSTSTSNAYQILFPSTVKKFQKLYPAQAGVSQLDEILLSLGLGKKWSALSLVLALPSAGNVECLQKLMCLELARSDDPEIAAWQLAELATPFPAVFALVAQSHEFMHHFYQTFRKDAKLAGLTDAQFGCGLVLLLHTTDHQWLHSLFKQHSVNLGARVMAVESPAACRGLMSLICVLPRVTKLTLDRYLITYLLGAVARLLPRVDLAEFASDSLLCREVADAACQLGLRHGEFLDAFREHVELVTPSEDFWSPSYAGHVLYLFAWMQHPAGKLPALWKGCYDSLPENSSRFRTASPTVLLRLCWSFVAMGYELPRWLSRQTGRAVALEIRTSGRVDWMYAELTAQCLPHIESDVDLGDGDELARLDTDIRHTAAADKLWSVELLANSPVQHVGGLFCIAVSDDGVLLPWPRTHDPLALTAAVAAMLPCKPVALLIENVHYFHADGTPAAALVRRKLELELLGWSVVHVELAKKATQNIVSECEKAIRMQLFTEKE